MDEKMNASKITEFDSNRTELGRDQQQQQPKIWQNDKENIEWQTNAEKQKPHREKSVATITEEISRNDKVQIKRIMMYCPNGFVRCILIFLAFLIFSVFCYFSTNNKNMGCSEERTFTKDFLFRQFFDRDSCTYTYLLADTNSKDAIIIDPVLELAERDAQFVQQQGLNLVFCMNTHMHADHVTGTGKLKQLLPGCKSVISRTSGAKADILLDPDDEVKFGKHRLVAKPTPGHTNGCMTYISYEQGIAFTGDTLLIRGCGRTDFQEGNPETLYHSVHKEIFTLPDNFKLFPAHDYKGQTVTTVWEEKLYNARLTKSLEEFVDIMKNLNLPYPKKMDVAVPLNKVCGIQE